MVKIFKKNNVHELNLYNNILFLSRNKFFYTNCGLSDTFQNRIHLIFIHASFLMGKINQNKSNKTYKEFSQKFFDLIFSQIELNMREIGYGDVVVNKNMKYLVKIFYNILINCKNFNKKSSKHKNIFFSKHLKKNSDQKNLNNMHLIRYFDTYQTFCVDLSYDNVLKGNLKFNYK